MVISKVCLNVFFLGLILAHSSCASVQDSTLLVELRGYILTDLGYKTRDQFFNTWSEGGKPAAVVYINPKNIVGSFGNKDSRVMGFGYDEVEAKKVAKKFDSLGYHTLLYKTYGTGRTELSPRFMSYSAESKSFIVLHEFIHHYIVDRKLNVPPVYLEALGDILGNYGTIEFAGQSPNVSMRRAKAQRSRNESLYKAINKSIERINSDSTQVSRVNSWCQRRVNKVLGDDLFQDDRFNYTVNNAYLFRYRAYTEKYFVLKKLLKKQKSIHGMLSAIEKAPSSPRDFEKYLEEL